MSRVHVCTMHALCHIVEKIIYLYIQFAWNDKDKRAQKENIAQLEQILSDIGLHGGNVKIVADKKRSPAKHEVPSKPSIGGVKARRLLSFNGELDQINRKATKGLEPGSKKGNVMVVCQCAGHHDWAYTGC